MIAHSPDSTLDAIRRDIDSIDDQILALLECRFAATGRVKASKSSDGSIASSPLRPAREAAMLRRLIGKAGPAVPPDVLVRLWRVILSASTQFQAPVTLHIDEALGKDPGMSLLMSQHFCGMQINLHPSPISALGALRASPGDLAIVDTTSSWASGFSGHANEDARIIGTLPVISTGTVPLLLIFGHAESQESGDDETIMLAPGPLKHLPAAIWQAALGSFTLISIPGFLGAGDHLLQDTISQCPGTRIAGRCPRPIKVST
jgi:chorismate mutase/prephenate dehydratase